MRFYNLILIVFLLLSNSAVSQFNFWQEFNEFQDVNIDNIFVGKLTDNIYLKPTNDELYIYSDNNNWLSFSNNLSNTSLSDAEELTNGSILFSSSINGIYKYSDNQIEQKNTGMENTKVTTIFVDNNGDIFAGTWFEGGLYKSSDNGESWQLLGLQNTDITDFIKYNGTSYVSIDGQGIKKSENNIDWQTSWFGNAFVYKFYIDLNGDLLAVTSLGIMKLVNDSWIDYHSEVAMINIIDFFETNNGTIVYLQSDGKVFRSFDKLKTIEELPIIDESKRIFHIAYAKNGKLIAGTSKGVFQTLGRIDQKNIYASYTYQDDDSIADYNDPIHLNINLVDDFGDPLQNYGLFYTDSRLIDQQFETTTNSQGNITIVINPDYYDPDGEYYISLFTYDNSEYIFAEELTINYTVKIETTPELFIELNPLNTLPIIKGDTLKYEISTLYEISGDYNYAKNVSLEISNTLNGNIINLETNEDGTGYFEILSKENDIAGQYSIIIKSTDETFIMNEDFTSDFVLENDVSVEIAKQDIDLKLLQSENTIEISTTSLIKRIRIYDLLGRNLDIANGNILITNGITGLHIIIIELENRIEVRKVML